MEHTLNSTWWFIILTGTANDENGWKINAKWYHKLKIRMPKGIKHGSRLAMNSRKGRNRFHLFDITEKVLRRWQRIILCRTRMYKMKTIHFRCTVYVSDSLNGMIDDNYLYLPKLHSTFIHIDHTNRQEEHRIWIFILMAWCQPNREWMFICSMAYDQPR